MRRHPEIGAEIVSHVEFLTTAALTVRHHHERFDGGGYPDGLAGAEIPLAARIFAVADALDAMTTDRPYRPGASVLGGPAGDRRGRRAPVRPRGRGRAGQHRRRRSLIASGRGLGKGRFMAAVLVVDDDPFIRQLIASTLEDTARDRPAEAGDGDRGAGGGRARAAADRVHGPEHAAHGRAGGDPPRALGARHAAHDRDADRLRRRRERARRRGGRRRPLPDQAVQPARAAEPGRRPEARAEPAVRGFLGLGANQGDRLAALRSARDALAGARRGGAWPRRRCTRPRRRARSPTSPTS